MTFNSELDSSNVAEQTRNRPLDTRYTSQSLSCGLLPCDEMGVEIIDVRPQSSSMVESCLLYTSDAADD